MNKTTSQGSRIVQRGLTDEEIDLAFQQSGTSTDEPPSPGPSTQLVPTQPSQPVLYSPRGYRWRDCGALAVILAGIAFGFKATTSTNWILESQNINELKSEIYSLKGLLLNRRQFPPSPSAPKIPSWQIPVKPSSPSNPVVANHNSSSDISPVSNESTTSSPVKENHSPEGSKVSCHLLSTEEGNKAVIDVKSQVRMEVQGEEEKRETKRSEEEEEDDEDDDVSHVDEEECLGVQTEDRRGGDGQINEQVEKLRRPEGASNENEID
ncbi:peroxisomal hypothetical protein [Limosa lapponica baueri]|uniref:Peroxisomal membrane protein PEX14 n=1 Tax=Limosa lapponica baueri TaxID=1758121 RepID=A0A2I0U3A2_LIMLA|nr:peroxisomal hypothetical protein [Limosa lapponica baueri]